MAEPSRLRILTCEATEKKITYLPVSYQESPTLSKHVLIPLYRGYSSTHAAVKWVLVDSPHSRHISPSVSLCTTPCSWNPLVSVSSSLSILSAQPLWHHHPDQSTTFSSTAGPKVSHDGSGEQTLQLYYRAFPVSLLHLVPSLSNS